MTFIQSVELDVKYELDLVDFTNSQEVEKSYEFFIANLLKNFANTQQNNLTIQDINKIILIIDNADTLKNGYLKVLDYLCDIQLT